MEVRVHDRDDRRVRHFPYFIEGLLHLLDGFTSVDCDEAEWSLDECLVRQSVADETPHAVAHRVQFSVESLGVLQERSIDNLTSITDSYEFVVVAKCPCCAHVEIVGRVVRNDVPG